MTASIVYFGLAMNSHSSSLTYIADFDPEMKEKFWPYMQLLKEQYCMHSSNVI